MTIRRRYMLLGFLLAVCVWADDALDPKREFLEDVPGDGSGKAKEYVPPYLITENAFVLDYSPAEAAARVSNYLRKSKIKFKGHYGKDGLGVDKLNLANLPLPSEVTKGDQLEGIVECKKKYCKMKLNIEKEKPVVEKAKDKVQAYHGLIIDRLRDYMKSYALRGYEDVWDNKPWARKILEHLNFIKHDYPQCHQFLNQVFWGKTTSKCVPKDSFYRMEIVKIRLDQLQPVLRISEVFELVEGAKYLFYDFHIYTNHYFDSSAKVYEVLPIKEKPKKSILVMTDIMDIDTLKLSSVARLLYKNQMHRAITDFQKDELKEIR